ncbi:hypothetical protein EYR36_004288 [Pleurotus pulmonarius]|nr:hypothetical protein EYR36_004288 [Pleurotus pulmonarius]KAF4603382.1 hypothetical protein EYR38_003795 [Pleurotus pulmonarius]
MDHADFVHSGFMPVNVWYRHSGQLIHEKISNVPVYHPLDSATMKPDATKPMFYVPATVDKGDFFVLASDIFARTGGNAESEAEAEVSLSEAESKTLWEVDFDAWQGDQDNDELPVAHQRLATSDLPSLSTSGDITSGSQDWVQIVRYAAQAEPAASAGSYPVSRFFKPEKDPNQKYKVFIVPSTTPAWLTKINTQEYQQLIADALKQVNNKETDATFDTSIVTAADPTWKMIGHNFLYFYDMYATSSEYTRMIDSKYKGPDRGCWPIRPWPTRADALKFDQELKGSRKTTNGRAHASDRADQTKVPFNRRYLSAQRSQPGVRSQEGVMHGSANDKAKILLGNVPAQSFWPDSLAEWLHRICFTAGGPVLQAEANFCFGTSECNTHMIQAENAVLALFDWLEKKKTGMKLFLTTVPRDSTGSRWLQEYVPGTTNLGDTQFVKPSDTEKPYVWAIPFLDYILTIEDANGNSFLNCAQQFDTFSRYIPLSLMGRLDNEVLKRILSKEFNAVSVSAPVAEAQVAPSSVSDPLILADYVYNTLPLLNLVDTPSEAPSFSEGQITFDRKSTLFGVNTLPIDIYKFQGSLPQGVDPPADGSPPLYEEAKVTLSVLSQIFPKLDKGPFDLIPFVNYKFIHQNCLIDKTKNIGWSFECEVDLGKSTNGIQDILRDLLGTASVTVQLTAFLMCPPEQTWETALESLSFTLVGALDLSNVDLGTNLKLIKIGVKLHAIRTFLGPSEPNALQYKMELFGEMSTTLPGSKRPSIFDFSLAEGGGTVSIHGQLQGGQWDDALGITNLKLNNVSALINFQLGKTKAFDIGLSAEFDLDSTVIGVSGTCASSGQCELTASLTNFSLENLAQVYRYIFGGDLKQPDVEVTFGEFSLSLSTSSGVEATFSNVEIDKKYTIEEASAKLARDGVELRASYSGKINVAPGVDIDEAQVALSFGTGNQKSYFWINGKTSWSSSSIATSLQFDVSAYFYKDKGGSSQYVLLGAVSGMDKWTFGSLLKDSCPDVLSNIGLTALSMLVASSNDIELGPLKPAQYKVQKGVTICAEVGDVNAIKGVLKGECPGILLSANLPDFALGISLPTPEIVDFGHDIKTLPIEIVLNVKQRTLSVSAGIVYQPKGGSSLEFDLILVLGLLDASATLSAKMDWTNPLGLCPQLTIQEVALMIALKYATFPVTGPNTLGIHGKFKIGNAAPDVITLVFGDDPTNLLLLVEVNDLDVNDLLRLTSSIINTRLPMLPDGTVICKHFSLYASPTGARFGGTTYEAGFSASLQLRIFSVSASASITVNTSGFKCQASVESFWFGPLYIQDAKLDVTWTLSQKYLYAAGRVKVAWWWISGHVSIGPTSSYSAAYAVASPDEDSSIEGSTALETTLHFPVFASYILPISIVGNSTPDDWQIPITMRPEEPVHFSGSFTAELLAHITTKVKEHIRRVVYDVMVSQPPPAPSEEIVAQQLSACEDNHSALVEKIALLEAEFKEYQRRLEALALNQSTAAEEHHSHIMKLNASHRELERKHAHTLRKIDLHEEHYNHVQAQVERKVQTASYERESAARRREGDVLGDIQRLESQISSTEAQLGLVNDTYGTVEDQSSLPWNAALLRRAADERRRLAARLTLFQSSHAALTDGSSSGTQPPSGPEDSALAQAQDELSTLRNERDQRRNQLDGEKDSLESEMDRSKEAIDRAHSGETWSRFVEAREAVEAHVATRSKHHSPLGQLILLDELDEEKSFTDNRQRLSQSVDMRSEVDSYTQTSQWIDDNQAAIPRIRQILEPFDPDSEEYISVRSIELAAHRDGGTFSNAGSDETDTLQDLVLDAQVTVRFAARDYTHPHKFTIRNHHALVHDIFRLLMEEGLSGNEE